MARFQFSVDSYPVPIVVYVPPEGVRHSFRLDVEDRQVPVLGLVCIVPHLRCEDDPSAPPFCHSEGLSRVDVLRPGYFEARSPEGVDHYASVSLLEHGASALRISVLVSRAPLNVSLFPPGSPLRRDSEADTEAARMDRRQSLLEEGLWLGKCDQPSDEARIKEAGIQVVVRNDPLEPLPFDIEHVVLDDDLNYSDVEACVKAFESAHERIQRLRATGKTVMLECTFIRGAALAAAHLMLRHGISAPEACRRVESAHYCDPRNYGACLVALDKRRKLA